MRKLHTFRNIITGETHTAELSDLELRYYLKSFWNLRVWAPAYEHPAPAEVGNYAMGA